MSSYRTYVPWSSSRGSSYSTDKTASLASSVDRSGSSSRYGGGSSYRTTGTTNPISSSLSSYRTGGSARASTTDSTTTGSGSTVSSIRDRYVGRTSSTPDSDKPIPRRYGASTYTPPEPPKPTPTLRFGSTSRFGGQIARSPISEKSPTIFGVSTEQEQNNKKLSASSSEIDNADKVTVITRATSPTPPSNSTYLRARRADMERTIQRVIQKQVTKPPCSDSESQTDDKGLLNKREAKKEEKETHSRISSSTPWSSSRYSPSYTPSATPSSSSRYSPRSTTSTSYTSSYARPTDLPLKSTTLSRTPEKDSTTPVRSSSVTKTSEKDNSTKTTPISPKEGKDPTRIGGFSYARPTDLPNLTSLNKVNSSESIDNDNKIKSSIKRSVSPLTPEKKVPLVGLTKETTEVIFPGNKASTDKLISPDRSKLPPPVPKSDSSKSAANKDFRKSILNMDLSNSSEDSKINSNSLVKNSLSQSKSLSRLSAGQKLPVAKLREMVVSKKTPSSSSSDESSSTESTESSSTESSDEEDEEEEEEEGINAQTSVGRNLSSKLSESKIQSSPSRTSAQMASADECSLPSDKPPRPPSNPRLRGKTDDIKTEEAKAVISKILSPVTNQIKKPVSTSSSDDQSDKNSKKNLQRNRSCKDIQRNISSKNIPEENKSMLKLRKFDSGERSGWLDNNDNITDKSKNGQYLTVPEIKEPTTGYKISRVESGEKAWWLQSSNDIPGVEKTKTASNGSLSKSESKSDVGKEKNLSPVQRIKRIESGERAWWLGSSSDVPGLEKSKSKSALPRNSTKSPEHRIRRIESGEKAWWQQDSGGDNTSSGIEPVPKDQSSNEKESDGNTEAVVSNGIASYNKQPYRDMKIRRVESGNLEWWLDSDEERKRKEEKRKAIREKPFIGKHTNIDDVLGTQAPPPAAFRTPRNTSSEDSDSGEELFIKADQVRIHDSSAKRASTISRPGMIKVFPITIFCPLVK